MAVRSPRPRTGPDRHASWSLALAGVLLGVATGLTRETPAGALGWLAATLSGHALQLEQAEGGIWEGRGQLAWRRASRPPVQLGRWQWSATLEQGMPAWRLAPLDGPLQGGMTVRAGLASASLERLQLQLRAEDLPSGLGTLDFLHPAGRLLLQSPHVALGGGAPAGQGRLDWQQASTSLAPVAPLGSWHADWTIGTEGTRFTVGTDAGPLHVEGQGRFAPDGRPTLQGRVWSDPAAATTLLPVLQLLGQPAADGSVAIEWH